MKSECMICYLDEVIRPSVLILAKMSCYVKTFKEKDRDKDKNEKNKFMSFCIDNDKLLEKYKIIWTKILQNIELNTLLVYHDRYIKNKIRSYGGKVNTNFCVLNVPEDGVGCESFTIISIDSLFVCLKSIYTAVLIKFWSSR